MFNALYNLKNIIIYLKKLYRVKKIVFSLSFFFILISLNMTIMSNLLYILIIYNLVNVSHIKNDAFRFFIVNALSAR